MHAGTRLDSVLCGCSGRRAVLGNIRGSLQGHQAGSNQELGRVSSRVAGVGPVDLVVLSGNPSQGRPAKMSNDANTRLFKAAAKTRQKLKMSLCTATLQLRKIQGERGVKKGEREIGGRREGEEGGKKKKRKISIYYYDVVSPG